MTQAASADQVLQQLTGYRPNAAVIAAVSTTPIVILAGISGAGKDVIRHKLITLPDYTTLITTTTRPPRENQGILEQDGIDYHFISWQQAKDMIDKEDFIETNIYAGNIYGTTLHELRAAAKSGKTIIAKSDVHGAASFRTISDHVQIIYILPPSYHVWYTRMLRRYSGSLQGHEADFQKRIAIAIEEFHFVQDRPYFTCVINDTIEQAVRDCLAAITHPDADNKDGRKLLTSLVKEFSEVYARLAP